MLEDYFIPIHCGPKNSKIKERINKLPAFLPFELILSDGSLDEIKALLYFFAIKSNSRKKILLPMQGYITFIRQQSYEATGTI